uniref:Secreted protein n=1 Tax=Anopheles marajoara TaxID=58244 RepID=A0A2M4C7B0_9DIPT
MLRAAGRAISRRCGLVLSLTLSSAFSLYSPRFCESSKLAASFCLLKCSCRAENHLFFSSASFSRPASRFFVLLRLFGPVTKLLCFWGTRNRSRSILVSKTVPDCVSVLVCLCGSLGINGGP